MRYNVISRKFNNTLHSRDLILWTIRSVLSIIDIQNYVRDMDRIGAWFACYPKRTLYRKGIDSEIRKQLKDTQLQLGASILLVLRRLFDSHLLIGRKRDTLSLIVRFCHVRFVDVDKFISELFVIENENPEVAACL